MSIIGSNILAGASGQGGGGYTIENSLRFRSSASAYLNRTPATAGNRKTWTWSGWVKRGALGSAIFFSAGTATSDVGNLQFVSDSIRVFDRVSSSNSTNCLTNAVFRDPSAWYHVVVVYDNTQATASNRVKVYVNAISQSFNSPTYPNQNYASGNFNKAVQHNVGRAGYSSGYFDGYLTEVNFIDGQALDPSSFGEYNEDTGVWQPVAYEGTYGTNGFYLPFSDATNTTTLVADSSGNGNDWTPNGISLTAGVTYDSMTDTPTIYADGGNYAVLNPLSKSPTQPTFQDGNLYANTATSAWQHSIGTIGVNSGKWYWEVLPGGINKFIGIAGDNFDRQATNGALTSTGVIAYFNGGAKRIDGGADSAYGASYTLGDVIGVALDIDGGTVTFYKNNVSQGAISLSLSTLDGNIIYPFNASYNNYFVINFGQRPFAYTPPTGFLPLHTGNLPDSTIVSGDDYFKTYLYTGNGGGLQVGEIQKPFTTYEVSNSLRLRSSASAYLNRTPATAGNRTTWTWSGWVKRGTVGTVQQLLMAGAAGANYTSLFFNSTDTLSLHNVTSSANTGRKFTTAVYRDPSAWYHMVAVFDTTNATPNDRIILYVNGERITSYSVDDNPSVNQISEVNNNSVHTISKNSTAAVQYLDGYLTEVNFIDGQALDPSSFGDYDGNNYWVPKAYTGTYGTNGFYLDFSDTTSTATLVADQSGAGNDWTPNNISLTAGTTYDSMVDSPTPYADAGNYAVLNPLDKYSASQITTGNANLQAQLYTLANGNVGYRATIGVSSGKWYWEVTVGAFQPARPNNYLGIDLVTTSITTINLVGVGGAATGYAYSTDGRTRNNGSFAAYGAAWTTGDIIGAALDLDAGTITWYKNGVSQGVGFTGIAAGTYTPSGSLYTDTVNGTYTVDMTYNFGQRPFAYTPPTDFKTLNSFNIPEVTNDLETPDLVWIKSRSASQSHTLFDSVRGVHNYLESDDTALEATDVNSLLQFNKNGFLLGASAAVNTSGRTYVGWGWKAGTAFSNDAGTNGATIASVGSVNQDAGFSVATLTAQSSGTGTFSHGLGVAPSMVIVKQTASAGTWVVYHASIGNGSYIILNTTGGSVAAASYWNSTSPSSTVVTLGTAWATAGALVAYCFADVEGYSKFGSYVGNNSPDGPFVYLGFRPAFLIIRSTSGGRDWLLWDTARGTANAVGLMDGAFQPNTPNTAYTGAGYEGIDLLSNGFKWRNNASANYNGTETYIYMAFAENPFKNALAR